jgi:hypothetical protein
LALAVAEEEAVVAAPVPVVVEEVAEVAEE